MLARARRISADSGTPCDDKLANCRTVDVLVCIPKRLDLNLHREQRTQCI